MSNINLFLESRIARLQKRPATRTDVAHVLTSRIINDTNSEDDLDLKYADACFCARELAEAGDALTTYMKHDGAIELEEIGFALQLIDSKLKEYYDTLESALKAEALQHA